MFSSKNPARRAAMLYGQLFIVLIALSGFSQARAAMIEWTVNNAVFTDENTLTGSFVWDTDLQSATAWNFAVTGNINPNFSDQVYSSASAGHSYFDYTTGGISVIGFKDDSPTRRIRFGLTDFSVLDVPLAMLSLAGDPGAVGANGFLECFNCSPFRLGKPGAFLSAAVVPLPAAVWLFGTALVGFVGLSRKRKIGLA